MHTGPGRRVRPPELTIVVVLTYVSAIAEIVTGVLVILARYAPGLDPAFRSFVTLTGAAIVLFGFLTVAVASGISRGGRVGRMILTVILAASVLVTVLSLLLDFDRLSFQLANLLVSGVALMVMWSGRAGRYFASQAA